MSNGFSFRKPGATALTTPAPVAQAPVPVAAPPPAQFRAPNAPGPARTAPRPGMFRGTAGVGKIFTKQYYGDGTYWIRIDLCKVITPRNDKEACVIESTVLRVLTDPEGRASPVGSTPSQMVKMSWDQWQRHPKNLMMAAESMTDEEAEATTDEEWDEALEAVFSPDNPLHGRVLEMTAVQVLTALGKQLQAQGVEMVKIRATPKTLFTQHNYRRRVSVEMEVAKELPEADLARLYKPGELQAAIEAERREIAAIKGTA